MASDGGGKIKQKRSQGPNKPYERRKSLLGRVTDTVKDLIAPSWLSGLVKKTSAGKPQHEPPGPGQGITEESDDEYFMSPPQSPPNATFGAPLREKTMVNNHTGLPQARTLTHYPAPVQGRPPYLPNFRAGKTVLETGRPTFSSAQLPLHISADSRLSANPQTDDNTSEHSDASKSTSGCSSMVPHPDKRDYQREILQLNESSLQKLKDQLNIPGLDRPTAQETTLPAPLKPGSSKDHHNISECATPGFMSRTWTSGFQTTRQREQNTRNLPSFNLSLFGTPGLGNTSLFGESSHGSPYYPGKVGYGGASQFRKGKMKSTAPYQVGAPYRTQIKAKPMSNPSGALTSSTAKRILETLERMSTPLSDAKKIPTDDVTLSESVLSFTPGSYHKRARIAGSTFLSRKTFDVPVRGPPTNQLSTPTIASIAKNRQQLSFSVVDTLPKSSSSSSAVRVIDAPIDIHADDSEKKSESSSLKKSDSQHSSFARSDTVLLQDSGRVGGKMKRDKSHHYSSKMVEEEDEQITVVDLKTDFTLPVTSMPKFNFGGSPAMTVPISKPGASPLTTAGSTSSPSLQFQFSSPIQSTKPELSPGSSSTDLNFKFSSPININDKESPKNMFSVGAGSMTPRLKDNSQDQAVEMAQPASRLKSGSVTDFLSGKTSSDKLETFSFGNSAKANFRFGNPSAAGIKENNVNSHFGKVPVPAMGKVSSVATTSAFSPASQLKPGSVMDILGSKPSTLNDSGGFKPSTQLKQGSVMDVLGKGTSDMPQSDNFWAKLSTPSNTWECDCCMLQNKAQDTKCIACGVAKPGQAAEKTVPAASKSGSGSITTGLATPAGGLWNNFTSAVDTWECPTCMIQNKLSNSKCVACGTENPAAKSLKSSPSGTDSNKTNLSSENSPGRWICDTCKVQNRTVQSKCVVCQAPRSGTNNANSNSMFSKASTGNSLMSQFKIPTGDWECDTCMIHNKSSSTKCIACETPRPGSKSATGSATPGGLKFATNAFSSGQSGFKFDSKSGGSEATTSSSSGFKFGGTALETSSNATGGFKFGSGHTDTEKSSNATDMTEGFKFGESATTATASTTSTTGGFSFGKKENDLSSEPVGSKTENGPGFVFGGKAEGNAESDKASVGSGFVFGGSDTASNSSRTKFSEAGAKSDTTPQSVAPVFGIATDTKPNSNIAFGQSGTANCTELFGFGAKTLNNNDKEAKLSVEESGKVPGGFSFNSGTTPQNTTQHTGETKPVFGGFSFKKEDTPAPIQTSSSSKTSGFTGFNFVKTEDNKPSVGIVPNQDNSKVPEQTATKRGRDDADSEPSAKKSFSFGAGSGKTSTPFSFPASTGTTDPPKLGNGSSDLFKFGQQPATSVAPSTAPLGTGGFGSITSGTSVFGGAGTPAGFGNTPTTSNNAFSSLPTPNFGTQSTTPFGSNAAPPPFGGTPASSSIPFGVNAAANPATTSASSSLFGNKASTFGGTASAGNAFGGAGGFGGTTGTSFGSAAPGSFGSTAGSGFGSFGSSTGGSFGSQASTGTAPAFGGTTSFGGSTTPFGSTPAATTAPNNTTANSGGFNFSTTPSFNFISAAPAANTGIFQFGAKADAGPSVAAAPVQQPAQPQITQTPSFGMPQPGQQSTPGFNFSATPAINFGAAPAPAGAFTFNAAPADGNPFSVSSSNSGAGSRKIKKAVRKIRK